MAMNNINQFPLREKGNDGNKGLRKSHRVPPFLMKTFEMVEDPNTNSIIKWGPTGTSFIICDHLRLCSELLPKYFKHTNLSSFTYQLSNYGFKSIGVLQWEYENYWFQAGKSHLLTNIIRRDQSLKLQINWYQSGVEAEMKSQREVNSRLKSEIEILKDKQDNLANGIASLKEYMENSDDNFRKLLVYFLEKSFKQVANQHDGKERLNVITNKRKAEDIQESSKNSGKKPKIEKKSE